MKTDSAPPSAILRAAEAESQEFPDKDREPSRDEGPPVEAVESAVATERPKPFSPRARTTVLVLGGLVAFFFLTHIAGILPPFLWAVVMAYVLNPLVKLLCRRTGLPRPAAVSAVFLVGIGSLVGLLLLAVPRLNAQIAQLVSDLPTLTTDFQNRFFGSTGKPLQIAGFSIDVPQVTRQVANSLNSFLNNFFGGAFSAVVTTVETITQLFLFVVVTFYLLLDAPNIGNYFKSVIPPAQREEVLDVAGRMNAVLSQYLRAQIVLIAIMGTASFIVLSIMEVRFAIVLAPIVGLLEIFPIIGPFAAITLVTIIALFSPPAFGLTTTASAVIVAVVFFILRQIEDYAVIPNIVGHAVKLHPALILFAVASGTVLGGALGLFIAVPLTGALRVLFAHLYAKLVPAHE